MPLETDEWVRLLAEDQQRWQTSFVVISNNHGTMDQEINLLLVIKILQIYNIKYVKSNILIIFA